MMDELIARLEKATGHDPRLNAAVGFAVGVFKLATGGTSIWDTRDQHMRVCKSSIDKAPEPFTQDEAEAAIGRQLGVPDYTGSLDAALTLVPEGSAWAVSHGDGDPSGYPLRYRATVMPPLDCNAGDSTDWHNRSPAIALCIAALKARAALTQQHSQ